MQPSQPAEVSTPSAKLAPLPEPWKGCELDEKGAHSANQRWPIALAVRG